MVANGSFTESDPVAITGSTAALREEEGMAQLGGGLIANGGTTLSAKDEFAYLYGDSASKASVSPQDDAVAPSEGDGAATSNTRRSFTWNFTGENGSRGTLNAGEAIIIDFTMQFNPNSSATTDVGSALVLSAYAGERSSWR